MFVLASCARPGTGSKDNFALRDVVAAAGTKVFVRNPIDSRAQLMHVTLNGVKIAELGAFEAIAADAKVGENTLMAQYFGLITSPADGLLRTFAMKPNQKRFFIAKHEYVYGSKGQSSGQKLVLIEIPQDGFFRY